MAQFPAYISASALEMFLSCPIQYRKTYIEKMPREPGNIYTAFGSAVHKALETNFSQKIESKVDLPLEQVIRAYNDAMTKELQEIGRVDNATLEMINLQGEEIIYKYMKYVAPTLQPIAAEFKFEIELKSVGVTILGYIDLIATVIDSNRTLIIDYKTAGTSTRQKRTQSYVDSMTQLSMYSLAYRKTYGKSEDGLRIEVLKRLKGSVGIAHVESVRHDSEILPLVSLLGTVKKIVEADLRYPNLLHCKECPLADKCNKT